MAGISQTPSDPSSFPVRTCGPNGFRISMQFHIGLHKYLRLCIYANLLGIFHKTEPRIQTENPKQKLHNKVS